MSVFPDMISQFGGVPVSSAGRFGGWWGRNTWFVDYDNGTAGATGQDMRSPQKNLKTVLDHTDFAAGDAIYIRSRTPDTTGGDPAAITPATAANWSIAYGDHGVSLIGTGIGLGSSGSQQTVLQGHASVTATPVLLIGAPYVTIENLGFKRGGSTVAGVKSLTDASTNYAFGTTYYNCWFRNITTGYGLITDASWYDNILKCTFSGCSEGLSIQAGNSVPVGIVVRDCDFEALVATVKADISTSGAVARILIRDCYFNHAVPSGGLPNRYINVAAASTGLVANCYTGAIDPTVADNMTLNGILYSNIWGDGVGPFVDV